MFKLKNNLWKIAGIVIVLFLAAAGAYYVWGMPAPTAEAAPLQTAKARTGDLSIVISGAGNLVAASRVDLGFRTGGTVMAVDTQVGQTVSEGQVLRLWIDPAPGKEGYAASWKFNASKTGDFNIWTAIALPG